MPKWHGFYRRGDSAPPWYDAPWMLVGIWEIFGAVARTDHVSDPGARKQAQSLEYHFRGVMSRLAHSLDLFQRGVAQWELFFNTRFEESDPGQALEVTVGTAADSSMVYLSIFMDDVARLIPFVLDTGVPRSVDSFGDIRNLIRNGQYPALKALFDRLDDPTSWWESSLRRGIGLRQRLVHYTDIIDFTGTKAPDEDRARVQCTVWNPLTGGQPIDFINALRSILRGLCDWLDDVEQALSSHLVGKASTLQVAWKPSPICPRVMIPVERPLGTREIPDEFLYLPLCDGSVSSRCRFTVAREGA